MLKKFSFVFITLCLSISALAAPLMANAGTKPFLIAEVTEEPAPPHSMERPMNPSAPGGGCKTCQRPFKRLVAAMHELKKANNITEDEFKKAFDALMKIPRETFKDVSDMDQTAADALYKDKVLTTEQYKKISEFLKNNPSNR